MVKEKKSHNKKIRILRVIARLNIGGPAMQSIFLNRVFNDELFESTLVYGSIDKSEGDMSYLLDKDSSHYICIKEMGRRLDLFKDFISFIKILMIMLKKKPHIVHTHTAKAGALGRTAAILCAVPIKVHTLHGHIFDGYFDAWKTGFFQKVESLLARFTDRLIVLSPALRDEIMAKLNIKDVSKFSVVPLGVEIEPFLHADKLKGQFKKELRLPEETRLIGIVGRLVPIKNHRMFIDAARLILDKSRKYPVKFIIVGDGQIHEEISFYAKDKGVIENVIFTGWRKDLDKIYADLDIVCLSSANEGTPVSVIEAMLAARPVVATDVGGVRDLIADSRTGYIVAKDDCTGFADRILKVLDDKEAAYKMGRLAREKVRNVYTKERLASDIGALYRELLKRRGLML